MAFLGDIGKAFGLGSTSDVTNFAVNAGTSALTGGFVPISTSPFERQEPQAMNPFEQQSRNMRMQSMGSQSGGSSFGNFFSNVGQSLGNFGQNVGGFFQDIAPLTNLLGGGGGFQRTNAGTAAAVDLGRPQETSMSGEYLGANLGLAPMLFQGAGRFLSRPGGQLALGLGGAAAGALMSGDGTSAPRVTRKMKSDVRRIYMMAGMDPALTAQILNNMGTYPRMDFNAALVFFILTKRFRNDGPVVTKAAVRKTKTTLRRMKGVVDMYNSVCKPTAPRRRAAPSRAKAVQLISNK